MSNIKLDFILRSKPSIRYLDDLRDLLYDRLWSKTAGNCELYYMYRNLSRVCDFSSQTVSREPCGFTRILDEDKTAIEKLGVGYDVTIIPPMMLGAEYVKTAGHYHPMSDCGLPYPEVYEVLEGVAHYLLQKLEEDRITDVVLVEAKKGDHVVIPPHYGHITINPSGKELKMANWVSGRFESIYEPIKEKRGGAYFELENNFVKNENYDNLPELRFVPPIDVPELGLVKGKPMYDLIKTPKKLEFLNRPDKYADLLGKVLD
ncbi:MAG: hypothetical protein MSIBF_04570 [Candidatus Altiarchaeales archaeon IMC4]|nr:MAG: hypothetical protein MSIBF_04570 [Candidatus Altiarchaeales archaeon IMC4]